jgi:anti-sigma factor RsiW
MNVTREVILDLLPVYLSGEASPATRSLVEEFLKQDPELAQKIRGQWLESMTRAVPSALPPELELKSFRRVRGLLSLQRWLMGLAMTFSALLLSNRFSVSGGRVTDFHFLLQDYPVPFTICLVLAVVFWVVYFAVRRNLRTT